MIVVEYILPRTQNDKNDKNDKTDRKVKHLEKINGNILKEVSVLKQKQHDDSVTLNRIENKTTVICETLQKHEEERK